MQVTTGIAGAHGRADLVVGVTVQTTGRSGFVDSVVDGGVEGVSAIETGGGVVTTIGALVLDATSTGTGSAGSGTTWLSSW